MVKGKSEAGLPCAPENQNTKKSQNNKIISEIFHLEIGGKIKSNIHIYIYIYIYKQQKGSESLRFQKILNFANI